MAALKRLARVLPPFLRSPVREAWRRVKGNPEFHLLELLADPDRVALDVGANAGIYTLRLAKRAARCHAFEPNPALARDVAERAQAAGLFNVEVHACALSDRDTEVTFRIPVVNGVEAGALATIEADNPLGGAAVNSYTVPCRRLDAVTLDPVGLMKVDAEGHEGAILLGASGLVARDRPAVMIEVEERHKPGSVEQVRRFFEKHGYRGWFLLGRRLVPVEAFRAVEHQDPAGIHADEVRFDAVYVNVFVYAADAHRTALLDGIAKAKRSL